MLNGDRIVLRSIKQEDLQSFLGWRSRMDIKKMALYHPFPVTLELEKEWFANVSVDKSNRTVVFSVEEKDTSRLIGFSMLTNINWVNRNCYFGIVLGEEKDRGKGYGFEVVEMMMRYAFDTLNLNKVSLEVVKTNEGATKLYERVGFNKEGELVEEVWSDNAYHNVLLYSLIRNKYVVRS